MNKRITKEYYEQHYAHIFDNLNKMHEVLERHKLPRLIQEKKDNLNRPTSITGIESKINNLQKEKAPGPDGFNGEFYQIFKLIMIPILYNFI